MTHSFSTMSAADLVEGYARGDFTPVEATRAALARASEFQPALNLFTHLDEESALAQAHRSAARWQAGQATGLLDGVPVAVKDTAAVRGWRTGFGSQSSRNASTAMEDAPLVQRMREQGAVFIGKTTAPEFAWKGVTDSTVSGITRNPWNPALTPGGSSGGSAAAVALGIVPIATGADGGGSLRIPASFSGVLGLKPTAFLVPNVPTPLGAMAVVGALTRTARDQALFLQSVVAPDRRDCFSAPIMAPDYLATLGQSLKGLRVGVSHTLGFGAPEPAVALAMAECETILREFDVTVEPVELALDDTLEAFEILWALAFSEILQRISPEDRDAAEPALLALHERTGTITGWQVQAAHRTARQAAMRMAAFFESHDLLLTPTVPILPFGAGRLTPDAARYPNWWDWTPLTWPFNLSRNPAISCPVGLGLGDLPIGAQFVAPQFAEPLLLRVAQTLERRIGLSQALTELPSTSGAAPASSAGIGEHPPLASEECCPQ